MSILTRQCQQIGSSSRALITTDGENGEYQAHVSSLTLMAPPIPRENSSKKTPSRHFTHLSGSSVPWKLNCNPGSSHFRDSLVEKGGGHTRVNHVSTSHLGDIRALHLVQSLSGGDCSSIAMLYLHCPSSGVLHSHKSSKGPRMHVRRLEPLRLSGRPSHPYRDSIANIGG